MHHEVAVVVVDGPRSIGIQQVNHVVKSFAVVDP